MEFSVDTTFNPESLLLLSIMLMIVAAFIVLLVKVAK